MNHMLDSPKDVCRLYKEIPHSMLDKLWANNNNEADMYYQ